MSVCVSVCVCARACVWRGRGFSLRVRAFVGGWARERLLAIMRPGRQSLRSLLMRMQLKQMPPYQCDCLSVSRITHTEDK